ncbi:DUF4337 domain-containing protein [Roseicella aquatilis]|uniref:DUF4337 domain-containing protein n=1 Tax=Roseicella aquatilis TaxID=2527868 RepID=A0A4R4DRX7_9PROT|nr:DUF4337 domain-containing protein [Roseicella aquatilis]TCZ65334.1 DUF4337 domain-containing protein [Roseicella aquatilis]
MAHAHQPHEELEHAHHAEGGGSKRIALLIAVLALFLAIGEMLGKSAQTDALARNIEAANLWSFFQAKTVRQTAVRTAMEEATLRLPTLDGPAREALERQVKAWTDTLARWESEPATGEGRRELTARAQAAEARRDRNMAAYHAYEYGSAAFQVAIVLASAAIITTVPALAGIAMALGVVGLALTGVGFLAPDILHH